MSVPTDVSNVPTLQQLCEQHFSSTRFPRSLEAALITLDKLQEIDTFQLIKTACVSYLRDRSELLLKQFEHSTLVRILGSEEVARMCDILLERANARRNFSYLTTGAVMDRPKPVVGTNQSSNGFYPYDSLRTGVEWPAGIDASNREKHLSPEEFECVFKMSKEAFCKLPHFVRIRTKKEVGMF